MKYLPLILLISLGACATKQAPVVTPVVIKPQPQYRSEPFQPPLSKGGEIKQGLTRNQVTDFLGSPIKVNQTDYSIVTKRRHTDRLHFAAAQCWHTAEGVHSFSGLCTVDVDIDSDFEFVHDCNAAWITVKQEGKTIKMEAIS